MISKKNIRYEGLLYSINESNATVALQNVRSFGTEGRDANDPETDFVAATEQVHPFLLFRGQDIKDLHVHENQDAPAAEGAASAAPAATSTATPKTSQDPPPLASEPTAPPPAPKAPAPRKAPPQQQSKPKPPHQQQHQQQKTGGNANASRRPRSSNKPGGGGGAAVGTGASLLNRKARGVVGDSHSEEDAKADFDFESHNQQFAKEVAEDEEAGDEPVDAGVGTYEKDDFFDSISCDAIDKKSGVDNRLRGREERHLNTETFGAVALNSNRRRGGGRGGRGRGGGRGGRGRGRGGGRRSQNWYNRSSNSASNNASSAPGGQQSRYSAND